MARSMLKIQRTAISDVVFTVTGRLEADNVSEVTAWSGGSYYTEAERGGVGPSTLVIQTPDCANYAVQGDWVFRDVDTDRYWVAPEGGFDDDYEEEDE